MLNYHVTCNDCYTTFSISEDSLLTSSSIMCPHCHTKLPSNELKHLKNDLHYRKKHSGFHVSILDSHDIDLEEIHSFALDSATKSINSFFENKGNQSDCITNVDNFISENTPILLFCNVYSMQLLKAYHKRLISALATQNISIGELMRKPFSPDSSVL